MAIAGGWLFIIGARFLVPAILPQVKATFQVGNAEAGLAVTLLWASYGVAQSPAGVLADRLGERRLLVGSLVLSALSAAAIGISPVFVAFVLACLAFGVGTGMYGPARGTALSRIFHDNDGAAFGVTLAAGSVGSAVLPFLAGSLAGTLGWRTVVLALLGPLTVAAGFAWWAVPDRSVEDDPETPAPRELADGVWRAMRMKPIVVSIAAVTLLLFAMQALTTFLPTYLVEVKGYPQSTASALFALMFVGGAVAQLTGGALADRFGAGPVLVVVAGGSAVTVGVLPFVDGLVPVAALVFLTGIRLAMVPVSNAYIIAILPAEVRGTAWGLIRTSFFLLGSSGSTVVGALADRGYFDESFLLLAAVGGVAAVLYLFLPARETASTSDA
jgi:predicted MFS family arabinose efflux permease